MERARTGAGQLAGFALGMAVACSAEAFTPLSGPVLSASSVSPNVVMLFDSSSSMVLNRIDGDTRLNIAREAAKDVINDNRDVRFGLFTFRSGTNAPGGLLRVPVGSIVQGTTAGETRFEALNDALDEVNPGTGGSGLTWTPLAESYYEVTRYMRGLRAFYPQSDAEQNREQFDSPIEYRCQKNFGLVLTDGLPTYDSQFPTTLAQEPAGNNAQVSGVFNLPNWDGDSKGDVNSPSPSSEGSTFYLDDIARFALDTDMRDTGDGTDQAGKSWDDPAFPTQNMKTFTVGFALDDSRLRDTATAGGGKYYTASDRTELKEALRTALREIMASSGSGGGATVDSQVLQAGTSRYYQSEFDPQDWSGSLSAQTLNAEGEPGTVLWSTDSTFTPANRPGVFQTWRLAHDAAVAGPVTLNGATRAMLAPVQQATLDNAAVQAGLTGEAGQTLLNWVRGQNVTGLRSRTSLLGDVINSSPVLVARHQATSGAPAAYRSSKQQLTESLVVGANDGFIRVFDTAGQHRYSFLPAGLHASLGARARSDYSNGNNHRSGVDGRLTVADLPLNGIWSTVAATGFGAGGKGLAAIRLFDANTGNNAIGALWEINAADPDWDALGHIYAQPVLARLNERSVLITGNGYGSASGTASLLVVDMATGVLIRKLDVSNREGVTQGNGLSAPVLHDDGSGNVSVFAGDLHGQLWKFDLSDADSTNWTTAHDGVPLFTAATDQPITVRPQVHRSADARDHLVLFGTGKFMEQADLTDTALQSFYAVRDTVSPPAGGLTPAHLQAQQIDSTTVSDGAGGTFRRVSANFVDWASQYGWRLPLISGAQAVGERVTRDFAVRDGKVYFNTGYIKPDTDPCMTQGAGWLMVVSVDSGGMAPGKFLDTNNDNNVDNDDEQVAGKDLDIGLPGDLNIVRREDDPEVSQTGCAPDIILVQGSSGVAVVTATATCRFDRINWRQRM
ncbi:pilus assembly protein [Pseudomonas sp. gcc21]|uniref:PilC/PilY family type IV pilus protein n=1 Tax=Pseudomonas sp. gcc21 TaxID=2726989 RepID=UPI0014516D24|nr:PilC/PilY family type IV pilus protein [Pseudomonas sp. gcc21]QJD60327.1 pilus assembly protein [Pseudomonas sp. gcc21]